MNSIIQPNYGQKTYSPSTKAHKAKQSGTHDSSFWDLATRVREKTKNIPEISSTKSVQQKMELSEAEDMQLFKQKFYEDLSKIIGHPTVNNVAVNISDTAFQAMKDDPEYRSQVLSLLQRDLDASYAPRNCSILITVGINPEQYSADSWSVGNDSEFRLHAKDSFWQRRTESHKKFMELQQEAAARRQLMMKLRMNNHSVSTAELLIGLL